MQSPPSRHDPHPLPALFDAAKELIVEELHTRLRAEGYPEIRPAHGCVFRFLDRNGSRLTYLAEAAGLTKQAVGEVVDYLEAVGYVERVPDPADRRAKIIRPTRRGRAVMRAAGRIFADIEARWAREFGERRTAAMRDILEDVVLGAQRRAAA
jgi:DNA-binding MarR family transcriptional regulator